MLRRYGCRGLQYRPGILIFDGTLYGRGAYTETAMTKKLTFALLALGLLACAPRPAGPVDYVDPFIGTGYHGHTYPGATTPFGMVQTARTCDRCGGSGRVIDSPCHTCNGSGRVRKQKTIEINIPAGVDNDQMLNVSGQGNAGANGGPSGDLHVYVNVRPHPIFERRGDDVWCEMPITFSQAALGAEVTVPTIDGRVSYQVREGTQPGDVFKLKGKGIPHINGRGRGDQYVRVNIEVPKNLSEKQKKLLREFEETSTDENQVKRKSFWDKVKDALKDK